MEFTRTETKEGTVIDITEMSSMTGRSFTEDAKVTIQIEVKHHTGWSLTWTGEVTVDEEGQVTCPLVEQLDPKPERFMKDPPKPICGAVEDALYEWGKQYDEVNVDEPEDDDRDKREWDDR